MNFWRFANADGLGTRLEVSYDLALVVLSVGIACLAGYTALMIADRILANRRRAQRRRWLAVGGGAMGVGIWAMHFTGMLAFSMPGEVQYDLTITLLSVLPALIGSVGALHYIARSALRWREFHLGAALLAAGIGAMHYTGMEAMLMPASLRYDFAVFALSLGVAHVLSMLALYMRFALAKRVRRYQTYWKMAASIPMGFAVAGMHYTAMSAAELYRAPVPEQTGLLFPHFAIALTITLVTVLILATTILATQAERWIHESQEWGRDAHRRLKLILESSADGILGIDRAGRTTFANSAAQALLGYDFRELRETALDALVDGPSQQDTPASTATDGHFYDAITDGREVHCEDGVFYTKSGRSIPVSYSSRPMLDDDGAILGSVIVFHDISQRKEAERLLKEAKEEAEASNAAKTRFLANMSHELRTPLNAIIGFSEILRDETFGPLGNPKYQDYSAEIHASGTHLLAIVNDLIDVASLDADQFNLAESTLVIRDIVEEAIRMLEVTAESAGVAILRTEGRAWDQMLIGDPRRLRQVLINLLSNALKFTPSGGSTSVSIHRHENGDLGLTIADTGIGMKMQDIATALEPFGQVQHASAYDYQGKGLGLALSKGIVEAHNGDLTISSIPGEGTHVHIVLPGERVLDGERVPESDTRASLGGYTNAH